MLFIWWACPAAAAAAEGLDAGERVGGAWRWGMCLLPTDGAAGGDLLLLPRSGWLAWVVVVVAPVPARGGG